MPKSLIQNSFSEKLLLVVFMGILIGPQFIAAQVTPQPIASRTAPLDPAAESAQLIDKLMMALEIDKKIASAIDMSDSFLKMKPQAKTPEAQAKINALYAQAEKDFVSSKASIKEKTLTAIKKEYAKQFTVNELKYLITLSQYDVFKKYNALLDSDNYKKATSTFFTLTREARNRLKAQVDKVEKPPQGKK